MASPVKAMFLGMMSSPCKACGTGSGKETLIYMSSGLHNTEASTGINRHPLGVWYPVIMVNPNVGNTGWSLSRETDPAAAVKNTTEDVACINTYTQTHA